MTPHPARAVASILLIVGSLIVGVTALAILIAKLLVDAGMAIRPSDALLLADLITVLPFVVLFAVAGAVAAAGRTLWHSGPRPSPSSSARSR